MVQSDLACAASFFCRSPSPFPKHLDELNNCRYCHVAVAAATLINAFLQETWPILKRQSWSEALPVMQGGCVGSSNPSGKVHTHVRVLDTNSIVQNSASAHRSQYSNAICEDILDIDASNLSDVRLHLQV